MVEDYLVLKARVEQQEKEAKEAEQAAANKAVVVHNGKCVCVGGWMCGWLCARVCVCVCGRYLLSLQVPPEKNISQRITRTLSRKSTHFVTHAPT